MTAPRRRDLRAFIGRNTNYYLDRWEWLREGNSGGAGFNLAAFLLPAFWLPYRKLWGATLALYGFLVVESLIEEGVFTLVLKRESPGGLGAVVGIATGAVCGSLGNRWYYAKAARVVVEVRARELGEEAAEDELARRGGTSLLAGFGLLGLLLAAMLGLFFVMEAVAGE